MPCKTRARNGSSAFVHTTHLPCGLLSVRCEKDEDEQLEGVCVSTQVSGDGADGREPVPGDPDGAGPREAFLPALPDAVWDQTPACGRHHSQGERHMRAKGQHQNAAMHLAPANCSTCLDKHSKGQRSMSASLVNAGMIISKGTAIVLCPVNWTLSSLQFPPFFPFISL